MGGRFCDVLIAWGGVWRDLARYKIQREKCFACIYVCMRVYMCVFVCVHVHVRVCVCVCVDVCQFLWKHNREREQQVCVASILITGNL